MVDRIFVEDEGCTLLKDIFQNFRSKQACLLLITLVMNKKDHWICIWDNAMKIPKLPAWNKLQKFKRNKIIIMAVVCKSANLVS